VADVRRFSQSEFKEFQCNRRWWLASYRRLGPVVYDPTGPLRSGSRVHTGLEAFYGPDPETYLDVLAQAQDADLRAWLDNCTALGIEPDQAVHAQFVKDCELERIMLSGYAEWVAESGVDAGIEFTAVEEIVSVRGSEFAPEIVERFGEFEVVGKLDARVVRLLDGARMFIDHKTAASLTSALATLHMNPQMLHYAWLEHMTQPPGTWTDGALYNVLKKVKRSKQAKPPFYARYEVSHNWEQIFAYEMHMKRKITKIFELESLLAGATIEEQAHIAEPSPDESCSWKCQFFTLCPMFDDGSRAEDMVREEFRERDPLARYAS
jgi:PD-(D/E)XK nuclease superfamily